MILERLRSIEERIAAAIARSGRRRESVTLLAVSKGQPASLLNDFLTAARGLGVPARFGENYLQELEEKYRALDGQAPFHFIGRLQRNKVRDVLPLVAVIESVDRLELAEGISKEAVRCGLTASVLLQVNVSHDPKKGGWLPETLPAAVEAVRLMPGLDVRGLMTIPALLPAPEDSRPSFRALATLQRELLDRGILPGHATVLSMGMSHDFEVAIEEGATEVRIGSALWERARS